MLERWVNSTGLLILRIISQRTNSIPAASNEPAAIAAMMSPRANLRSEVTSGGATETSWGAATGATTGAGAGSAASSGSADGAGTGGAGGGGKSYAAATSAIKRARAALPG